MLFALVPLGRSRLRASTLLRGEPDPATSTNFDEPPAVVGWDPGSDVIKLTWLLAGVSSHHSPCDSRARP